MFCTARNPPGRRPTNIRAVSIWPRCLILTIGGETKGTQFNYRLKNDGQPYASVPDPMDHAAFRQMLDQVEQHLVRMGRAIFAGDIEINPYQKGADARLRLLRIPGHLPH